MGTTTPAYEAVHSLSLKEGIKSRPLLFTIS